ncbi:DUF930 domain-containing protein [Allorhizobium taibaishanense]|uniref:DUF930 domain-containing protein n=1 Tax=Allorhizobium taibaishanense TaxID=887144 RepID=A0A1Q9A3R7_9HYPH|nr:DUF930 domain-containing protein [Allorhizobium taibaishanense]MBB4006255.1 hypothetical protein [Allorhizobium taibaishanense]OLP49233.1 hypothetical protein BJF91_19350 [Allorhizobium taibaishanense]
MQDQPPPIPSDQASIDQDLTDRTLADQAMPDVAAQDPASTPDHGPQPISAMRMPLSRRVRWGIAASVLLHGLLLVAVLVPWPIRAPDAPKEEVVSVSLEPPPAEKEKPKPAPEKQLQLELKPQPKDAPAPSASAQKQAEEKKAEEKKAPEKKTESKDSAKPPPSPDDAQAKPAEDKSQALESALKDETAPEDKEAPEPPPTETQAPDIKGPPPTAAKTGPDKSASGDPQKTEPPAPPALPKDVTPPETGLSPLLPTPDQIEKPHGGVVTEERFSLGENSASQPQQNPAGVPVPSAPPAEKSSGPVSSLKPAKRIYSKATLADSRVRQALGKLPPEKRIVQICSIEMLEQIRRAVPGVVPDLIAPSPSTRQTITARLMDVSGAAFRSKGQWYDIGYHCETDAKTETISSFSYSLGAAVPKSQWQARRFPAN